MCRVVCLGILLNGKVQSQDVAMMRLNLGPACFELLSRLLLVNLSNPCRHPIRQSTSFIMVPSPDIRPLLLSASCIHDYLEICNFYLLETRIRPSHQIAQCHQSRERTGRLELNAYRFPFLYNLTLLILVCWNCLVAVHPWTSLLFFRCLFFSSFDISSAHPFDVSSSGINSILHPK
jgi:hypothetical protein